MKGTTIKTRTTNIMDLKKKPEQKQKTCIFIRGKEHNITEQNRNASKQAKKICRRQSNIHLTRKRMKRRQ